LCVFSLADRASFEEISEFREQIVRVHEEQNAKPIILVGNKCDLTDQRQVSADEGAALARSWGAMYVETSAKTKLNVDQAWFDLVKRIRLDRQAREVGAEEKGPCCTIA
jgi:small GTP-binding protein